ncbi:hypothetical protein BDV93DRAFT_364455 [Ceratobasidium sp. AG-I]|nr:hypothetical protein BDV93DRAFT_364455 [Ceratobasidium sp. AG-I]
MHIRGKVVDRISKASTPDISRWTMLLGANIISSLLDGNLPQKAGQYKLWIERFEKELDSTPVEELDSTQVQGRYTDTLELAFFKLRLSDRENPYKILRQMVPTFLQIAFSVSSLWENQLDFTSISVADVLASERGELAHFLLMDILCSMIYGVPQVLEYDTSTPPRGLYKYPIHGCAAEFQIILAEINARCARCSIADDWQAIEQRLLDWKAPFFDTEGPEPWRAIAQLAVQECWRQALLIYLYMAVCGVSSHDSRVQLCVRQTFQLIRTVKKIDPAHPHFLVQFIIAGACTRHEAHRTLARARLSDMSERGMWLMAGSDFVPVLDHLWHGAAANGRAIQWSDYLASRQIALPLNE